MRKLVAAPFELRERLLQLIAREAENARRALPARIIAKINALAERQTIEALYAASQAGVKIDLIVRGLCCLRPGVEGVSRVRPRPEVERVRAQAAPQVGLAGGADRNGARDRR